MRLFGEIGGATLEGPEVNLRGVDVQISRQNFKCLKTIVAWRILRVQQIFLHIATHKFVGVCTLFTTLTSTANGPF